MSEVFLQPNFFSREFRSLPASGTYTIAIDVRSKVTRYAVDIIFTASSTFCAVRKNI